MIKLQKSILFILLTISVNTSYAQKTTLLVGAKGQYNIRSQKEVFSENNNFRDLKPLNSIGTSVMAEIIYRPTNKFFIGSGVGLGLNTFRYDISADFSKYGYNNNNNILLPKMRQEYFTPYMIFNAGYSINMQKYQLDIGAGLISEPGIERGNRTSIGSIFDNADGISRDYIRMEVNLGKYGEFYQNLFARMTINKSKWKLLQNMFFGFGYQTQFFGRRQSLNGVDAYFITKNGAELLNRHRDFHNSFYLTIQRSI